MKERNLSKKIKRILPSKKFAIVMGVSAILLFAIFGVLFLVKGEEKFASKKNKELKNKTVSELVQQDTDGDSIPDWEEALWGTDKHSRTTFDGTPDVTYIANKKKELNLQEGVDELTANETDKFAQQFFSTYAALKAGEVDNQTINNFSSALGQKIIDPNLIDKYKEGDIKATSADSDEAHVLYYVNLMEIYQTHLDAGLGDELEIVAGGLITSDSVDSANMEELLIIADAYTAFAAEIMTITVPKALTEYHLRIANSSNNTGISVANMVKVINDPIVGLTGLSQYQKYSDELVQSVEDLQKAL